MTISRAKILIVDDEMINIRMLDSILRDKYEIIVALNGEQALKRAVLTPPDIILLDIAMDGMDGYQIYQYLAGNEATRDIPIIFVTALASEAEETKGLELGAVDYITKPYRPSIIRARLNNHLELKRQRDQLNYLSSRDSLTGISNKRGFEIFLDQAWERAVRFDEPIVLIYMGIDCFKKYNDNYGYIAGNKCLKKVADRLKACMNRKTDLLARYGGDEFVCVLSKTDIDGALQVAKKLRATLLDGAIPHQYAATGVVTLSFGVAAINPVWQKIGSSVLIGTASGLLFQAKQQGGDQVCHKMMK
ncbi:MAG: diguanylate cyclase [Methylovulum sp.]|nr:diguanylate cyclase [Methylovulum sp.]